MIALERARRELAEAEAEVIEAERRLGTAQAWRDRKRSAFEVADAERRATDYFSQVWGANEEKLFERVADKLLGEEWKYPLRAGS